MLRRPDPLGEIVEAGNKLAQLKKKTAMTTTLHDLPYTSRKETPFKAFRSSAEAMRNLTKNNAVTTAWDSGSLTLWWGDEDEQWHGELHRYGVTRAKIAARIKSNLKEFVNTHHLS